MGGIYHWYRAVGIVVYDISTMSDNKTKPTEVTVDDFLATVSKQRAAEAQIVIRIMHQITNQPAVMWGPSIIGFGSVHYKYATGHEGDMPMLGFSPRKAAMTVYFMEGFTDTYQEKLQRLGKHKVSKACLYIAKLSDVDLNVLTEMLEACYQRWKDGAA